MLLHLKSEDFNFLQINLVLLLKQFRKHNLFFFANFKHVLIFDYVNCSVFWRMNSFLLTRSVLLLQYNKTWKATCEEVKIKCKINLNTIKIIRPFVLFKIIWLANQTICKICGTKKRWNGSSSCLNLLLFPPIWLLLKRIRKSK